VQAEEGQLFGLADSLGDEDQKGAMMVEREVVGFFKEHPYLLVSEERLAALLCRPPHMVTQAVKCMEEAGLLVRKDNQTLLGICESLEKIKGE
jgi:DNA-binding MarR family transcriptional regulator